MSVVLEKLRDDGEVVRQEKERWRLGQNWDIGEEDELSALIPADRLVWGDFETVQDGPSEDNPLFGWYLGSDVSTLESDDYLDQHLWMTLDHSAGALTLGSGDVDVLLTGVDAGEVVYGGAGGKLVGLAHPGAADRVLTSTMTALQWSTTITYSALPAVGGTWSFGATNTLALEGQLVTSASTTGRAGLILTPGVAPTGGGLVDGAFWVTSTLAQCRVNGATVTMGVALPLATTSGGTGLTAYTTGDLPYASAANTLARLAIGATGAFLRVTAGLPSWSTLTLPNTIAAGRVLVTSTTDTVAGLAPTANRALVADGSSWAAGTLAFGALPTGSSGSWTLGGGFTLTIANRTEFSDGIKVSGAYGLGGTTPANPRTVTGSRGANAALASLLTQLAAHGVIVDSTTV